MKTHVQVLLAQILALRWCLTVHGESLEDQFMKLSRQKRYLTIPSGSAIGLLLAFAVPVDLPNQDVLLSWNMEGNYNLPDQLYYFNTPPPIPDLNQDPVLPDPERRSLRSITRKGTYHMFQQRMQSFGLDGEACLLRTICEVSQSALDHNGLIGHLLHVLFSPSTSRKENISSKFLEAEINGIDGKDCSQVYFRCTHSIVDMFTDSD